MDEFEDNREKENMTAKDLHKEKVMNCVNIIYRGKLTFHNKIRVR